MPWKLSAIPELKGIDLHVPSLLLFFAKYVKLSSHVFSSFLWSCQFKHCATKHSHEQVHVIRWTNFANNKEANDVSFSARGVGKIFNTTVSRCWCVKINQNRDLGKSCLDEDEEVRQSGRCYKCFASFYTLFNSLLPRRGLFTIRNERTAI